MSNVQLAFGMTAPPIRTQLRQQQVTFNDDDCTHWQLDADAISRLNVRQILPDAETRKARARLVDVIARGCR
jgi:hypothetical protein